MEQTANTTPQVTLGQYKGLEITRRVRPVTENAVELEVNNQARIHAPFCPTEAPAARGCRVTLDFAGFPPPGQPDAERDCPAGHRPADARR